MSQESYKIDDVTEYDRVKKALSKKGQPNKVMCFLMNALESYRQARKMGWSRPWNKYDLTVFQTFRLKFTEDAELLDFASEVLLNDIAMSSSASAFVKELLDDKKHLMGFVFVHEYMDNGQLYEGVTFSIGRVNDKKYRDRVDLILESPVEGDKSQGLSRMRVYIDPYTGSKEPLWIGTISEKLTNNAFQLFHLLTNVSWDWATNEEKLWQHWTSNYIDYFGPRRNELAMSYFYQQQPDTRIVDVEERAA